MFIKMLIIKKNLLIVLVPPDLLVPLALPVNGDRITRAFDHKRVFTRLRIALHHRHMLAAEVAPFQLVVETTRQEAFMRSGGGCGRHRRVWSKVDRKFISIKIKINFSFFFCFCQ